MSDLVNIKIGKEVKKYPAGTTLEAIAKEYDGASEYNNILAVMNEKLCELHKKVRNNSEIRFVTTSEQIGNQAYRRSVTLLMLKAFYEIVGNKNIDKVVVQYSISKGYYCEYFGKTVLTEELLERVEARMHELVDKKIPIRKRVVSRDKALELFKRHKMYDKYNLFKFKLSSEVNLYDIEGFEDYYYGYMASNTGYLRYFKLYMYGNGFVLQMPVKEAPCEIPKFCPQEKLAVVLDESTRWGNLAGISTVGDLNEHIVNGSLNEMILVQEALQEKKLAELADTISSDKHIRFIMIAGPSSSGKTTFAKRLGIQLLAHGIKPYAIGVDDYYIDRERTPRDADGNYDFESLRAIDINQFNDDMRSLLNGERVEIPTYNFKTGKREYKGRYIKLNDGDILIIEGIHCLNDELSYALPSDSKFKIYISALMSLNLDEHNTISTTDLRLIRRIVRDARTRGSSAQETISMWGSVRRGEEENIFPYQETADAMFNSAMVYEMAVLKQYAEPELFSVPKGCPEYQDAKKILKFLDYFLGMDSANVPKNSLIREFIGGGCFE